jgi:hypothetical protein
MASAAAEPGFYHEYLKALWKKFWLLIIGVIAGVIGAIAIVWKPLHIARIPAFLIALVALMVAQVLVAKGLWTQRNQARIDLLRKEQEVLEARQQEAPAGVRVTGSTNVTVDGNVTYFEGPLLTDRTEEEGS